MKKKHAHKQTMDRITYNPMTPKPRQNKIRIYIRVIIYYTQDQFVTDF